MHCTARSGMTNSRNWDVARPMTGSVTNGSQKRQERQNKLNGTRCSLKRSLPTGVAMESKRFASFHLDYCNAPSSQNRISEE